MENIDINAFLDQDQQKDLLRFLTAGSVDDGKSTLIGRLLFDSKKLYEDQLSALERDSKREGHAGDDIDYALLTDGLKAEREQGITIDVAYRYFSTNRRKFIIADTPGHEQYTRNMVTGASTANLAIILVDATKGIITQTRRHTFLVSLLNIKHVVLAVNKMDLVDYNQDIFNQICDDYRNFVTQLQIPDIEFIPLSALKGENIIEPSVRMPWFHGKSILEHLESVHISSDRNLNDLRIPVQYVLRPDKDFRGFAARIASGIVRKGDTLKVLPSLKSSIVKSIVTYDGEKDYAFPPQSVTITLEDEIDISRGDMLVHPDNMPRIDRHFEAMLVWMDESPMDLNAQFYIKQTTVFTRAKIDAIGYKVDVNTLEKTSLDRFALNDIGRVVITTTKPLYFDPYNGNRQTGSFVLIDPVTHNTCAVGMIIDKLQSAEIPLGQSVVEKSVYFGFQSKIKSAERQTRYNQRGATLWINGLPGSGKSNFAQNLERHLFDAGAVAAVFDGAILGSVLLDELSAGREERVENLRRVANLCRLMNDQGIITICAYATAEQEIRGQVKSIVGSDNFIEVYIDATTEYCRSRKPELYQKADSGDLLHFPGVDFPFEDSQDADCIINPDEEMLVPNQLIRLLAERKIFPAEHKTP